LKKKIILSIVLALIAFSTIGMWGDILDARGALKGFAWWLIPIIAFFGFMNDMIKFVRWDIYLRKLGIMLSIRQSLIVFVSGLSMSATPGKVGLLIKSRMLSRLCGRSFLSSTPVIVAELYLDLIALSVISFMAVGVLNKGVWIAVCLCCVPLLGLIPAVARKSIDLLAHLPFVKERAQELGHAMNDMFMLLGPGTLIQTFAVTLIAWTSEGVALYLILAGLGFDIGILHATAIFGFATLMGVLSMLPGGLIVTDAGLMGLIIHAGVPRASAAVATILARVFTLWLAVLVGSVVLISNHAFLDSYLGEVNEGE